MIYLLLLLDIIINNYTNFTSFFFLVYLYKKPYKYYLLTALILDFIVFNSYYNIIILSALYLMNKIFKDLNKDNFYSYLFAVTFNYIYYIILSNLLSLNSILSILFIIGKNLFINLLFYLLMYNILKNNKYKIKQF